jgi:hypothetical protein
MGCPLEAIFQGEVVFQVRLSSRGGCSPGKVVLQGRLFSSGGCSPGEVVLQGRLSSRGGCPLFLINMKLNMKDLHNVIDGSPKTSFFFGDFFLNEKYGRSKISSEIG